MTTDTIYTRQHLAEAGQINDFRKIAGIEAYAPTDNVSELTARTNDEGWASVFVEWLKTSRLNNVVVPTVNPKPSLPIPRRFRPLSGTC